MSVNNLTVVVTGLDDYIVHPFASYIMEQCKNMNMCKEIRVTAEHENCMEDARKMGAREFIVDYNQVETLNKAFTGADWVVLTPEMRGNREEMKKRLHSLIDCASRMKVGGVIMISSVGADSKYHELEIFSDIEKYLFAKCAGMRCVVLRGAMLFRELLFFSRNVVEKKEFQLPMLPTNRFAPVSLLDIGDCVVSCMMGKAKERAYTITGPKLFSGVEMANELSTALGVTIQFREMSMSDFEKLLKDGSVDPGCTWPKVPSRLHGSWLMDHFKLVRDEKLQFSSEDFKKLNGKEGRSISSFFKENSQSFRPH